MILYCKKTFNAQYKSGKSFTVRIVHKKTGKGIVTQLRVDYTKKGFRSMNITSQIPNE